MRTNRATSRGCARLEINVLFWNTTTSHQWKPCILADVKKRKQRPLQGQSKTFHWLRVGRVAHSRRAWYTQGRLLVWGMFLYNNSMGTWDLFVIYKVTFKDDFFIINFFLFPKTEQIPYPGEGLQQ